MGVWMGECVRVYVQNNESARAKESKRVC